MGASPTSRFYETKLFNINDINRLLVTMPLQNRIDFPSHYVPQNSLAVQQRPASDLVTILKIPLSGAVSLKKNQRLNPQRKGFRSSKTWKLG
jgi:hypothetical protein